MASPHDGASESVPSAPAPRRWRLAMTIALVGAALIHPAARVLGRHAWHIDLLTHFQGPALIATVVALLAVARRRPRLAAGLGVLALLQVVPMLRYDGPNPVAPDPRSNARLRILMANVLWSNEDYADLARVIRRERPDVVGLVEYSPEWVEGLEEVRREYPFRLEAPRAAKGLGLWFRHPPSSIDPVDTPGPGAWPFIHATFEFGGRTRHLWLIHPSSPFRRKGLAELAALARQVSSVPGSRIVVGDMNCSEGSPLFADFLAETGLRDSRLGFGRQASWPAGYLYRIAIDHAFVSDDLAVVDRHLGPTIGSDHLPLIVELAPAGPASAASIAKSGSASR